MTRCLRALVAAAALVAYPACAEFVVVVNPKNPVTSLTARQVAQIYLGRVGSFPAGGRATPIDLPEGTALRDEFYARVAEKNPDQVKAYWAKQLFSGNGTPPREAPGVAEVKRTVAADATAIGYIDRASLDASVKEILSVR